MSLNYQRNSTQRLVNCSVDQVVTDQYTFITRYHHIHLVCGRLLGHCAQCAGLCLQTMSDDLKTAWRLSFIDEMRVRGVLYMRRAIQIDDFAFFTFTSLRSTEL